jgi:hypothetical protein
VSTEGAELRGGICVLVDTLDKTKVWELTTKSETVLDGVHDHVRESVGQVKLLRKDEELAKV